VVGEPMIKSVIGSDANFPIQWTESSAKNASVIATGANVLSPLIDKFESLLKVAAQNSESGSAGTGTVVTTGSLSNALTAISLSQSGAALENILYLSTSAFSNKSLSLLHSKPDANTFFSVLQKQIVPYSNVSYHRIIHITSTALSQDLERRSNQLKAWDAFGCKPYSKYFILTFDKISVYCLPNKALFNISFSDQREPKVFTKLTSSGVIDTFQSYLLGRGKGSIYYDDIDGQYSTEGYNFTDRCYFFRSGSLVAENCYPNRPFSYCTLLDDEHCTIDHIPLIYPDNSQNLCPLGLFPDDHLFIPDDVLVCAPDASDDVVHKNVYDTHKLRPVFELYPDFTFKLNPYSSKITSPDFFLSQDRSYIFYPLNDPQNPLISVFVALKVFSDGFLLSRTVGGLKINRQGSITTEVDLQIREIEKYDFDFNLVERNLSFWTGDGFDIGIQNSFLSPKTYGIAGKTIAAQFAIRTLSSDMVLPEEKKEGDGGVVPCGLAKDVQVLKTRKNAEGKDENYFETQNSPACNIAWGAPPTYPKVDGEPSENQTREEKEKELLDQLNGFFKDFIKNFNSDSKKSFFPVTEQCPPFEIDFREAPMLKGKKLSFNQHCEEIAKNPSIQSTIRFVSMIVWFFTALFRLFHA